MNSMILDNNECEERAVVDDRNSGTTKREGGWTVTNYGVGVHV